MDHCVLPGDVSECGIDVGVQFLCRCTKSRVPSIVEQNTAQCRCDMQADYNGRTTLHLAVAENRTEIVRVLLDKGAKTDISDTWRSTPLLDALSNRRVEIAAILIGKGLLSHNGRMFTSHYECVLCSLRSTVAHV